MVAVAGNSLANLVQACAREIGPYHAFTSSQDSGGATTVIASTMADSEAPVERYGGYYLYQNAGGTLAGQQKRVTRGGFVGATGAFTVVGAFTGAPQNLTPWTLMGTIPYIAQDGLVGGRECINRALRKLWVPDRLAIAATTGTLSYDLGAYWWASKKRFVRLHEPAVGSQTPAPSGQGWRVVADGETWTLELDTGFATGETFYLAVERPANSKLYLTGAWAEQSSPVAGLVIDADACLGAWNTVFQCSLYEVFSALAIQAGGARKSYWADRRNEQALVVGLIKEFEADQESVTLGEGQSDAPGTWDTVVGDHGFWSR